MDKMERKLYISVGKAKKHLGKAVDRLNRRIIENEEARFNAWVHRGVSGAEYTAKGDKLYKRCERLKECVLTRVEALNLYCLKHG